MVEFQRLEQLPHILIQREPAQPLYRPRPGRGAKVQPRLDRQQHADRIKEQTFASVEQISKLRAEFGVVPGRLLVLRLQTLDADQHDTLERMNVNILV